MIYIETSSLLRLLIKDAHSLVLARFPTHDSRQAEGAKKLCFNVLMPGVD